MIQRIVTGKIGQCLFDMVEPTVDIEQIALLLGGSVIGRLTLNGQDIWQVELGIAPAAGDCVLLLLTGKQFCQPIAIQENAAILSSQPHDR